MEDASRDLDSRKPHTKVAPMNGSHPAAAQLPPPPLAPSSAPQGARHDDLPPPMASVSSAYETTTPHVGRYAAPSSDPAAPFDTISPDTTQLSSSLTALRIDQLSSSSTSSGAPGVQNSVTTTPPPPPPTGWNGLGVAPAFLPPPSTAAVRLPAAVVSTADGAHRTSFRRWKWDSATLPTATASAVAAAAAASPSTSRHASSRSSSSNGSGGRSSRGRRNGTVPVSDTAGMPASPVPPPSPHEDYRYANATLCAAAMDALETEAMLLAGMKTDVDARTAAVAAAAAFRAVAPLLAEPERAALRHVFMSASPRECLLAVADAAIARTDRTAVTRQSPAPTHAPFVPAAHPAHQARVAPDLEHAARHSPFTDHDARGATASYATQDPVRTDAPSSALNFDMASTAGMYVTPALAPDAARLSPASLSLASSTLRSAAPNGYDDTTAGGAGSLWGAPSAWTAQSPPRVERTPPQPVASLWTTRAKPAPPQDRRRTRAGSPSTAVPWSAEIEQATAASSLDANAPAFNVRSPP